MNTTIRTTLVSVLCCFWLVVSVHADSGWLFASLLEKKKILTYERNGDTGALIKQHEIECPAEPAFLAVSPDRQTLLVSFRSTGQLASYHINADSGELSLLSIVEGGEDPAYLECDRSGQFVASAYYVSNKVSVHRLSERGKIHPEPICSIATSERAHGIAFDSKNRYVFVPHTGSNRIYQFHFDPDSGNLSLNKVPYLVTPEHFQPRHLMMHPSDRWAYASHEAGDSLGVYAVDQQQGRLRLMQDVSSIPDSFDGAMNTTARCEITRDGRFVYVANRGHNSVACYAIDQNTGRVTALGTVSTEPIPRSLTIDSSGRFLYVAGQASGRIAGYRIMSSGKLNRRMTVEAGPVAWCVLAVDRSLEVSREGN